MSRIIFAALYLFGILAWISFLTGSPPPKARPKVAPVAVRPSIVGTWDITWNGMTAGVATFRKDGYFRCLWCGDLWEGSWRIETRDKTDVLTVTETTITDTETNATKTILWSATLTQLLLSGTISQEVPAIRRGSTEFKLVPTKAPPVPAAVPLPEPPGEKL